MDSLIFMPDPVVAAKVDDNDNTMLGMEQSISGMGSGEKGKGIVDEDIKVEVDAENIERPVDLYKVCLCLT